MTTAVVAVLLIVIGVALVLTGGVLAYNLAGLSIGFGAGLLQCLHRHRHRPRQ